MIGFLRDMWWGFSNTPVRTYDGVNLGDPREVAEYEARYARGLRAAFIGTALIAVSLFGVAVTLGLLFDGCTA